MLGVFKVGILVLGQYLSQFYLRNSDLGTYYRLPLSRPGHSRALTPQTERQVLQFKVLCLVFPLFDCSRRSLSLLLFEDLVTAGALCSAPAFL